MADERKYCTRVTGWATERHLATLPAQRHGQRRQEPKVTAQGYQEMVYDVLCGSPASYEVEGSRDGWGHRDRRHACTHCLEATIAQVVKSVNLYHNASVQVLMLPHHYDWLTQYRYNQQERERLLNERLKDA